MGNSGKRIATGVATGGLSETYNGARDLGSKLFDTPKINPDVLDPLRPEYRPLANDLATYARTLVGKGMTPYGGKFTADMSPGETSILDEINKMVMGGDGASSPLGNLAFGDQRSKLISDILSGSRLSPETNPYLGGTLDYFRNQAGRTLSGNMNLLDAAFNRAGVGGSGRSMQSIDLARRSGEDVNGQIANILSNNYQQGLGEQMSTLGTILPGMDAFKASTLFSALGANALPRTLQQNDLNARYSDFLRGLNEPLTYASMAQQILGGAPGLQYSSPQFQPSIFSQILDSLKQGAETYKNIKTGGAA